MLTSVVSDSQNISVINEAISPLMEVHLVNTDDIFYKKGRVLAENVYRQIWSTENLIDNNDYAIVVCQNGNAIGNMNIQVRSKEKFLKSETFFGLEHWQNYFKTEDGLIAESSALAISRNIPQDLSRPVMMLLLTGMITICRLEGIKFLVTVQHEYLSRILIKSLNLPFFINQNITKPQGTVPKDQYWNRDKSPRLYYLEPLSSLAAENCYSYLTYLNLKGIPTAFLPRTQRTDLSYSTFRKNLNQVVKIQMSETGIREALEA